jgi:hypothetical protein
VEIPPPMWFTSVKLLTSCQMSMDLAGAASASVVDRGCFARFFGAIGVAMDRSRIICFLPKSTHADLEHGHIFSF